MWKKNIKLILYASMILLSTQFAFAKKEKLNDLSIEPNQLQTNADEEHEFVVRGGKAPYTFKTSSGMIRFKDNVATYISPNNPGAATVTVVDATGITKTVQINIIAEIKESAE